MAIVKNSHFLLSMNLNLNNFNIFPNPSDSARQPGGVNSVIADHALGFLELGYSINAGAGVNIVHALAQHKDIDVFHCHGLYPIGKNYFDTSFSHANGVILENALRAKVTVCISEFSANILRHKLHIDPVVTRNGIWIDEYKKAGNPKGAILFPKTTLSPISRPDDIFYLRGEKKLNLLSIAKINGIKSTGVQTREDFITTLQNSAIYLGTTKENNSMATMEAMISGVPVVGYDYGFNAEWLINGNGCELVRPGDQVGLKEAIYKVLGNWNQYSTQARAYAEIFNWKPVIQELVNLYQKVYENQEQAKVSIIIPVHNYGKYVAQAIESALNQTVQCEVIVIDDCSTDDSLAVAQRYSDRIKIISNESNLGVAQTRNKAIAQSVGEYIVCLDADDTMRPDFVEKHIQAFKSRQDAITYAPIALMDETGKNINQRLFHRPARPELQSAGANQIPSCCMFRRVWWKKAGGYDGHYSPAEDAHLWLKIFSLGGVPVRVSSASMMDYRIHTNSLSSKGFPNWWSEHKISYSAPVMERDAIITIILDTAVDAERTLWSLESQTYPNWNCVIPESNQQVENLKKVFPWLNRSLSRQNSVLHIKAGTVLSPDYLKTYMTQPPDWISEPRRLSLSLS